MNFQKKTFKSTFLCDIGLRDSFELQPLGLFLHPLAVWVFSVEQRAPHLHLTTSKVMVIVWRLRGNIIRTVLYIANVLPLQWHS